MHTKLVGVVLVLAGCSPRVSTIGELPDAGPPTTLTVTGRVCTEPVQPFAFPVKVVMLVDQSGPACIIDGPGVQSGLGWCSVPPGVTQPARMRALLQLLTQLSMPPGVLAAVIPFSTTEHESSPSSGFTFANSRDLQRSVGELIRVGQLSDLQGAFESALARISADVTEVTARKPQELARTRYVVMLVSVGPPNPRCAAQDNLSVYADDLNPTAGPWPDSSNDACNQSPSMLQGFVPGTERNQNRQLFELVGQLRSLQTSAGVADIRVHTALLSNATAVAACGAACDGLFGGRTRWPGPMLVRNEYEAVLSDGRFLMRELAARGNGVFTEFQNPEGLATATFDPALFESLQSPNVLRELLPEPRMVVPSNGAWALDDDGDGVSNDEERAAGTNAQLADSDDDGFDDRFELDRKALGFDPSVKDERGCNPPRPATLSCGPRDIDGDGPPDVDGDGLSDFAEAFLGIATTPTVDADQDGFPDGLEVKFGLDPASPLDDRTDSDGDGVTDANELRRGSHPLQPDAALPVMSATWTPSTQPDGSQCYDYTISGVPQLEGWARGAQVGVNLLKVWLGTVPSRARGSGTWKTACLASQRALSATPPVLDPPGLTSTLDEKAFKTPFELDGRAELRLGCLNGLKLLVP